MKTPLIKTRFAPSPTGFIHLGNARTALFNALYAYHYDGIFLLRIEDTDKERCQTIYSQQLLEDLQWLGLSWQEGPEIGGEQSPYYQSARQTIYANYYAQLAQQNQVYPCFCSPQELALSRKLQRVAGQAPRYAGTCAHLSDAEVARKLAQGLQPALRFRVPADQKVVFEDVVRGIQTFNTDELGDFIIQRTEGTPAFFFCNAVDDALMEVTHVFRGEDHLTNTPRQILLLQALCLPIPKYGHISLIVGNDNIPLSKRNGSRTIQALRDEGWLAHGMVNYLARLGHTYQQEGFLTLAELAEYFSVERLGHAPAHFDSQHLHYWQRLAISHATTDKLWQWLDPSVHTLVPEHLREKFVQTIQPNITFPKEVLFWAKILFTDEFSLSPEAQAVITEAGEDFFQQALRILQHVQADYQALTTQLKQATGAKGKRLFMPLRAALTGEVHGPEMANLLPLLGVERAQRRLENGIVYSVSLDKS